MPELSGKIIKPYFLKRKLIQSNILVFYWSLSHWIEKGMVNSLRSRKPFAL